MKRTAAFLEVEISEAELKKLCDHLSFASMKDNKSVNYMDVGDEIKKQNKMADDPSLQFIHSGESGGWKKKLSKEMIGEIFSCLIFNFITSTLTGSYEDSSSSCVYVEYFLQKEWMNGQSVTWKARSLTTTLGLEASLRTIILILITCCIPVSGMHYSAVTSL